MKNNKVFKGVATIGKSSMGWFYGFKLHLIINHIGELLNFELTKANVDDRTPVPNLVKKIKGKVFGDKGYISQDLFKDLYEKGIELVTSTKKNMKAKLMTVENKLLLRKRSVIESVNDQLKNISQIEHSRHRSRTGFLSNLLGGLIAYCLKEKKPSLKYNLLGLEELYDNNVLAVY